MMVLPAGLGVADDGRGAELVDAVTGIGHQLSVAQELFSVADVFAWTLVLVALLFLLEALLVRLETHVLRWRA